MSELTILFLVLLFDIWAIIHVSRDYMKKEAPDWLTIPFIFFFGVIGGGIIAMIYKLL